MEKEKIERINFLSKKSKTEGLTDAEREEQAARSCCAVKTLPKNVLCEIEAIAVK